MKQAAWLLVLMASMAIGQTAPPQLTEIQRLKIENIQLKAGAINAQVQNLQTQLQGLQKEYADQIAELEKAYPGYQWNGQALVKKPEAPAKK